MNETVEVAENTEAEAPKEKPSLITEEIKSAFSTAIEAGKDEDSIKIELISAGAKFKNVTRIFNDLMIEGGYALSKEDKENAVKEAIGDLDLTEEENLNSAIASMVEDANVTEKSAAASIRAYARKNEIEYFKKPKSTGSGAARNTFVADYHDALFENPLMTEAEAEKFIRDHCERSGSENPVRWISSHQKIRELANKIASKYN